MSSNALTYLDYSNIWNSNNSRYQSMLAAKFLFPNDRITSFSISPFFNPHKWRPGRDRKCRYLLIGTAVDGDPFCVAGPILVKVPRSSGKAWITWFHVTITVQYHRRRKPTLFISNRWWLNVTAKFFFSNKEAWTNTICIVLNGLLLKFEFKIVTCMSVFKSLEIVLQLIEKQWFLWK